MTLMPGLLSLLTAGLVLAAVAHGVAVLLIGIEHRTGRLSALPTVVLCLGTGALASWAVGGDGATIVIVAVIVAGLAVIELTRRPRFFISGVLLLVTYVVFIPFALGWSAWFVATVDLSSVTRALMLAGAPLIVLGMPATLVRTFENWEVLCRREWRRPRHPLAEDPGRTHFPRVSIHVPAHAEPPEVVMATLDSLARVDYPNFEVLVIDNNTADPALWRPVEDHCEALGERFRANMAAYGIVDQGDDPNAGSTDMANVSWVCPTIHPDLAIAPEGTPGHSILFRDAAASERADEVTLLAATLVAQTALELFSDPELVASAWREFHSTG